VNIWILQTGEPLQIDSSGSRPMRAMNLSKALIDQGHHVTLWSSDFDHFSKQHRYGVEKTINFSSQLTIRLIKSRGYKSHIGLSRLFDHAQLGWNLRKMLRSESAPDIAFVGYPPIEPAWIICRWLNRRNTPFILDIKDDWPRVLVKAFPNSLQPLAKVAFFPYQLMMKTSYKCATALSSISDSFLIDSLQSAGRAKSEFDRVIPLTSPVFELSEIETQEANNYWDALGVTENAPKRVFFVGTLNHVFDFTPVVFAARNSDIEFVIAGDGPQRNHLINECKELSNVIFPGWISSAQIAILAERSQLSLAPTKSRLDFERSIPNKFVDSLRLGKPIVSSLGGTSADLINRTKTGFVYKSEIVNDLLNKLLAAFQDFDLISEMSKAAEELYNKEFDSNKIYRELVAHLDFLARKFDTHE
jgi:glycosyltransferase involved in cell wall biosynthesis